LVSSTASLNGEKLDLNERRSKPNLEGGCKERKVYNFPTLGGEKGVAGNGVLGGRAFF